MDDVLTTFPTTFNEEIVESQMARLLEKRAKQPQNRRHRLAELAARHTAPGRTWPLRVARPGL
ncbi:hypothetical protein [Streptomyces sp. NPDC031705]|uniref:hypothetical protein n=1 Tax=Streptomyces sp. NPDC031705 TaxID=3155729 RepID=UPI0033D64F1F